MSLTVFLALSVLGVDFMIYALFQWTYGEKRAEIARKIAAQREALDEQAPRPFIVASRRRPDEGPRRSFGGRVA